MKLLARLKKLLRTSDGDPRTEALRYVVATEQARTDGMMLVAVSEAQLSAFEKALEGAEESARCEEAAARSALERGDGHAARVAASRCITENRLAAEARDRLAAHRRVVRELHRNLDALSAEARRAAAEVASLDAREVAAAAAVRLHAMRSELGRSVEHPQIGALRDRAETREAEHDAWRELAEYDTGSDSDSDSDSDSEHEATVDALLARLALPEDTTP